ncbi:PucR family transcriptional regulator ligand-binding domain-containing protein [Herbiconiux sp. VKM Ac-1786]|uniref:PucR family transcriptional regulator n=1 Tax=Herbiconiux sp. VKM Ac-1786 TaxID=2783824 RepID=UPI00188D458E|nr:PucR family transcriptional regulator [Herbiconiux sp. VKM Ac-1786]MBF4573012.1 PucR family transcriptional regulator ligand-binding domain-containing protein [Herbiconiux sp. VKM Ac-1786]
MVTTLDEIVALPELGLTVLVPGGGASAAWPAGGGVAGGAASAGGPARAVEWAHGSDLDDPTPFLAPGHLLLTTGRQFDGYGARDYRSYVGRLVAAGVVALGFGTEVVRAGTPAELVAACAAAGLPLLEIPYRTPFIAVARAIADREAAAARERVEWALAVQDALTRAVGRGGLSAAVAAAADALAAEIWVFDADAGVLEHAGRTAHAPHALAGAVGTRDAGHDAGRSAADVAAEVLARGRRARIREPLASGTLLVQTLGASGRHPGAVAVARGEPLDAPAESVVSTLAALAELALEHADDLRAGHRSILQQLFELLREGRVDAVRRAAEVLRIELPSEPLTVVAVPLVALTPAFRDRLERSSSPAGARFAVAHGTHLILLVDGGTAVTERRMLDEALVPAGASTPGGWDELDALVAQARRALDRAEPGRSTGFDELTGDGLLGLLEAGSAPGTATTREFARARLAPLRRTPEGREQLHAADVWLRHNGRWDPAARELGLHRHSLRLRIETLGAALGLALDTFPARAELWALLAASGPTPAPPPPRIR